MPAIATPTAPSGWYPDPWVPGGLRWWADGQWTGYTTPPPPAGWYADPALAHAVRYWNGSEWTDHVAYRQQEVDRGGKSSPGPREWAPWLAPVALIAALGATAVLGIPLYLAVGENEDELALVYVGSMLQYAAFVAAAIGFAWIRKRPRASDFGFRRPKGWSSAGWAVLALFGFWVTAGIYGAIVAPEDEPEPLDDLGLDEGTAFIWLAAALVIVAAPLVEEFFFRGFFYPALRARWRVWTAAAMTGIVFGAMHIFNGPLFVPPLMVFGAILCVLYEWTRSLYPGIAIHAAQNSLAFGVSAGEPVPVAVLGGGMLLGLLVASIRSPARDPAAV